MLAAMNKLLIVQAAALGWEFLRHSAGEELAGLRFAPAGSVLPAVTCTAQASFRTASPPADHGMIANGRCFRDLRKVMFWEQSAGLVAGERIWSGFRRRGKRVAMLFWQQSLGEDVDLLLSPAPIHKHHGGMIDTCYSRPADVYERLCRAVGRRFRLRHYWGPLAGAKAGDWVAAATAALLTDGRDAPDLCLTYLPTLDYDLQRHGPDHPKAAAALKALAAQLDVVTSAAKETGFDVLVFGDYAIGRAERAVLPNLALRRAGLMATREVRGMLYPDLHAGRAFAMVDHEAAHVCCFDPTAVDDARETLAALDGVDRVLDRDAQAAVGLNHPNAGELVLLARPGCWLAYPWWERRGEAPDYAGHVDIHNKPGFDPCELRFGWPPGSVSRDTGKVRGSHGLTEPGREIAWASTFDLPGEPAALIDLAGAVRRRLDGS